MISYEHLLTLIKTNENWKTLLESEPRFVKIKQCTWKNDDGSLECPELYMLSYDGISSDFNDLYVRLCRGCIVSLENPNSPQMIACPFVKFGNQGQSFCPEIDWESALVEQKVDGILIKLFYYKNKWRWVTNNGWSTDVPFEMITKLPSKHEENETKGFNVVQDLIDFCLAKNNVDLNKFSPDYTYMFELISPRLRMLVNNPKTDLVYLGLRNNHTYTEYSLDSAKALVPVISNFNTVKYFDLHNLEEVTNLCNSYKGDEDEGVVVVDKNFNRVKIKCKDYIRLKGYRNMIDTTDEQVLKGIRENSIDDALQFFPEIENRIVSIKKTMNEYRELLINYGKIGKKQYQEILLKELDEKQSRRIYADWVLKNYNEYKTAFFEGIRENPDYDYVLNHVKYKEMIKALTNERNK